MFKKKRHIKITYFFFHFPFPFFPSFLPTWEAGGTDRRILSSRQAQEKLARTKIETKGLLVWFKWQRGPGFDSQHCKRKKKRGGGEKINYAKEEI
jgi:hypothetical protein